MVSGSTSGNNLHLAWARCRVTVPGWQPAANSFLISSMCVRGWCFGGSCSSATSAVAKASVTTHSSRPVIPFLGIGLFLASCQSLSASSCSGSLEKQACHVLRPGVRGKKRQATIRPILSQAIFSQGLAVNLLGKRSENYSGRDTKSPESMSVMVGADPLAARELPKAIILPRQGNFLPNLTASRRSFYLAGSLPSPTGSHRLSGDDGRKTTSDSDAGPRFTGPISQNRP